MWKKLWKVLNCKVNGIVFEITYPLNFSTRCNASGARSSVGMSATLTR